MKTPWARPVGSWRLAEAPVADAGIGSVSTLLTRRQRAQPLSCEGDCCPGAPGRTGTLRAQVLGAWPPALLESCGPRRAPPAPLVPSQGLHGGRGGTKGTGPAARPDSPSGSRW